ncbi:hypothetical protein RYX36_010693, partial [Vicia faba]
IDYGSIQWEYVEVDYSDDDYSRWVPAIEMYFYCLEEVKIYYQEYSLKKGFGWRIRSSKRERMGSSAT